MTNRRLPPPAPLPPSVRVARGVRALLAAFAALALLAAAPGARAQDVPTRIVVLPFDAQGVDPAWEFGLATLVQRSLNALDRVYAPPVGDAALFSLRAGAAGDPAALERAFGADAVIAGRVEAAEGGGFVVIAIATREGVEPVGVRARADTPGALAAVTVQSALQAAAAVMDAATGGAVGPEPSPPDVQEALRIASEIPDPEALAAVANASSRIGAPDLPALEAAVAASPGSSWARSEYARALALAGRLDEALAEAARAQEAQPVDVEAIAARGVIELAAGREDAARASFDRALALAPSHAPSLTGRARLEPDDARARALLERAVAASPRYVDARVALADRAGSPARALQALRRAVDELPESIALHREIVERALAAGDPAGALAYLRDAAERPLAASPALYALAGAAGEARPEAALELVREGRARYPDDAGLARLEVRLLDGLGRAEEAATVLEAAAELVSGDAQLAVRVADARLAAGDRAGAIEVLRAAPRDEPAAAARLAALLLEDGADAEAAAALEAAAARADAPPSLLVLRGRALAGAGRIAEARAVLERALAAEPGSEDAARLLAALPEGAPVAPAAEIQLEGEAAASFQEGLELLEAGDAPAAAEAFARARASSGEPLLAFYEGVALQSAGREREAVAAYEAALEGRPGDGRVLANLGFAWLQLGRFDRALPTLRDAVAADASNARAHLNLGLAYYGLGRWSDALAAWDEATRLEPGLAAAIEGPRERAASLAAE